MSIIQSIRGRYAKIAGFVIALALVGFILMDATSGPGSSIFSRDESIAKVNGTKLDAKEYNQRVADFEALTELYSKGQQKIDENMRAQIRQQVLNDMVYEAAIADDLERLGIINTEAELREATHGNAPDPIVQQFPYFADPNTGQFNPAYIKAFEEQVPKMEDVQQRERLMQQWEALQRYVARARLTQKFNNAVAGAAYTPQFISKRGVDEMSQMASVRFVKIPYATIPDEQVKVTDADLKAYMEKHKARYTLTEPTRSIEYVTFDLMPSGEDTAASLGALTAMAAEFGSAADVETFVNRNSDERYTNKYVTKKTFQSVMADSVIAAPVGSVFGPYFENGAYQLVRVVDKKSVPDSTKARHILIATGQQTGRDDSAAHKLADSIVALIKGGMAFDTANARFSDDQVAKAKGGDLGYFAQGMMVPEFDEAAFNGTVGELQTVKTQFGWHILQVQNQKDFQPAAKLAIIRKDLAPSQVTNDATYGRATQFAGDNKNAKDFDAAATKAGLTKRVGDNIRLADFQVQGLGPAREIVRWAWENEVGDVSDPFSIDGRYIVARVSAANDAGLANIDATMRPQLEAAVRAERKADMIAKQYKGQANLDAIATASKQPIQQADSFNAANPFAPSIGFEPKVVGYAFYDGLKPGAVSPAIKGSDGVFFLQLVSRGTNPAGTDPMMAMQQRQQLEQQAKQAVMGGLQQAVIKRAEVKYNAQNL